MEDGKCLPWEDAYTQKMLTLGRCLPSEDAYTRKMLTFGRYLPWERSVQSWMV